jgi:hypothetical protein
MTEPNTPDAVPAAEAAPAPKPRKRWWHRWKLILAGIVATPVLLFTLYTWMVLNWSYSDGERAGTLMKFSRKGWLCKTWEGELIQPTPPGVAPMIWSFSVREERVADELMANLGKNVVLYYSEHKGVPTDCFGETPYFIHSMRVNR